MKMRSDTLFLSATVSSNIYIYSPHLRLHAFVHPIYKYKYLCLNPKQLQPPFNESIPNISLHTQVSAVG